MIKNLIEIECYKAKIEEIPGGYRIYFYNAVEKGGDTEVILEHKITMTLEKEKR